MYIQIGVLMEEKEGKIEEKLRIKWLITST